MKRILTTLLVVLTLSVSAQIQPTKPYRSSTSNMVADSALTARQLLIPTYTTPSLGLWADRWGQSFGINRTDNRLTVRGNGQWLSFPSFTEVQTMVGAIDLSNYVTLSTTQEIEGQKTFLGNINLETYNDPFFNWGRLSGTEGLKLVDPTFGGTTGVMAQGNYTFYSTQYSKQGFVQELTSDWSGVISSNSVVTMPRNKSGVMALISDIPASADLSLYQLRSEKGSANGYASLGADTKIPIGQIPALTTSSVTEGSNLYYTEARVNTNTNVAANTAARHNPVTIGTANGLSLSTQALSLGLASTSTIGALSSTDWNTFNNKQAAGSYQPQLNGTGFIKASGTTITYDNSTYEPAFTKLSGFNKNFGAVAGTVVQGDDDRVTNGQTAFGWGNHAGLYPTYNGTGATGTWGISISNNAGTVTNGLYSTGSYTNPSWLVSLDYSKLTGTPTFNLQGITTGVGNNTTPNSIQVTDALNTNTAIQSTILYNYGTAVNAGGFGITDGASFRRIAEYSAATGKTILYNDLHTQNLQLQEQTSLDAGAVLSGRMKIQDAINTDEAITLGQLTSRNLQAITTGTSNNQTTNALIVAGSDNYNGDEDGLVSIWGSLSSYITYNVGGIQKSSINFSGDGSFNLSPTDGAGLRIFAHSGDIATRAAELGGRLKLTDAVDPEEATTLGQVNTLITAIPPADLSTLIPYTGATTDVNLGSHTITSSGGFLGNATTAGTVTTAAQPTITSVGTLSGLTVTAPIAGSITGNAATATNGVVTTGSYADPAFITSLAYAKLTGAPSIPTDANLVHLTGNETKVGRLTLATPAASAGSASLAPLVVTGGKAGGNTGTTGTVSSNTAPNINITAGAGGDIIGITSGTALAGSGAKVNITGGDGGNTFGTPTTSFPGSGGDVVFQAGGSYGGVAGTSQQKAGNNYKVGGFGGDTFIVPGWGNNSSASNSAYDGTMWMGYSPGGTTRGNVVLNATVDDRINKFQITGNMMRTNVLTGTLVTPVSESVLKYGTNTIHAEIKGFNTYNGDSGAGWRFFVNTDGGGIGTPTAQESLTLNYNGSVGVNNSNPSGAYSLDVTGDIRTSGNVDIATAPTSGTHAVNKTYVDGLLSTVSSGTYTPTVTNVANVSGSSSIQPGHYIRVGNEVTVRGSFTIAVTTVNSGTTFEITLPISSTFTANGQLSGFGILAAGSGSYTAPKIDADSATGQARFNYLPGSISSAEIFYSFTYTVN